MNTPNTSFQDLNLNHAHESEQHKREKWNIADKLTRMEFKLVLFEKGCDVLAAKQCGKKFYQLANEVELSSRNVTRNACRNLINSNYDGTLIFTPDFQMLAEIARKLARELPPELHSKVGLATLNTLKLLVP